MTGSRRFVTGRRNLPGSSCMVMRYVNRSHTGRCTTNRLPLGADPEPTFWDLMSASADCGLYRCMRRCARSVHQRLGSDSHAQSRCLIASDCRRVPQRGEYPCVGQNGALGSIVPFERSAMVDLLSASQMQRITALNWERPLTCRGDPLREHAPNVVLLAAGPLTRVTGFDRVDAAFRRSSC